MNKPLGILLALLLLVMALFVSTSRAEATDINSGIRISACEVVGIAGPVAQVECTDTLGNIIPAGQVNLETVIDEVLVPGPTITLPPITKFVERPRATRTITVPGPTKYVTPEASTQRVFVSGPTRTVAGPVRTTTVTPDSMAVEATVTATETVTRQTTVYRDKVVPDNKPDEFLFDFPPVSTPEAVGIGIGAVVALMLLVLLALMGGYAIGYKDSDKENANFMNALRDKILYRGKHS